MKKYTQLNEKWFIENIKPLTQTEFENYNNTPEDEKHNFIKEIINKNKTEITDKILIEKLNDFKLNLLDNNFNIIKIEILDKENAWEGLVTSKFKIETT
jgi:hypothetical protein